MNREPRGANAIEKIVVHVNVGPEIERGAESLKGYLDRNTFGYHKVRDDKATLTLARDDEIVWGAGGMNTHALHICLIGKADQSAEEWDDAYSRGELDGAAYDVAQWCKTYQIPAIRLTPEQVKTSGMRGICGHVDVSAVFPESQGHWDPGPNFPWAKFLGLVQHFLGVSPPSVQEDDVPLPTDVVDTLTNQWGRWHLTADGGVRTKRGKYYGSYPGLRDDQTLGIRHFHRGSIEDRGDGREGYVLTANDGSEYNFP